ncbi:MAG: metallophosphoesterase family protein [Thermoleophilia bacterium]|nr:metallophosphoesterase family protein [Thermoleophilia bacterium]
MPGRLLQFLFALIVLVTMTVGGVVVGLRAGGETDQQTSFATVQTAVSPARNGHITVFVPLVDWKLDVLDHGAPVNITLELRGIDRRQARASISSRANATASLADAKRDAKVVVRDAVERGVWAASIGGIVGGIVGGALLGALLLRRRWLVSGPIIGVLVTTALVVPSVVALGRIDPSGISATTASGGHAQELPYVLQFSRQLLSVGDEYEKHFTTALNSVDNLVAFASRDASNRAAPSATKLRSMYLVSDIHDNVFVLDAFDRFARNDIVFADGDFGQVGAKVEENIAPRIAQLGGTVIAVSGNHDSSTFMDSLRKAGATVLEDATVTVDGLLVAGYTDPLQTRTSDTGGHVLRVYGDEYETHVDDFLQWFDNLDAWPDVVLVHQHGFGHRLAKALAQRGEKRRLVILVGHDHKAHVEQVGSSVIVDGGTLGAGGPFAIGSQSASFAKLNLRGNTLVSVDVVSVDPLSGDADAKRTVIR